MGKGKLAKFAAMSAFPHVFEYPAGLTTTAPAFFDNGNPIVLELGCGKGEYTVELARRNPQCNYIGIDIKGARMYTGARISAEAGLGNVAFLRTRIEFIEQFFSPNSISEIWITFPDPQMKKTGKRLTSTYFLARYSKFLRSGALIHLKTDSPFLYTYTRAMLSLNPLPVIADIEDIAAADLEKHPLLSVQTYYEQQWRARGLTIKYLCFTLGANTKEPLQEPDIEIPHDTYRI